MFKVILRSIFAMLVVSFGAVGFAHAQNVSAYLGLGSATDSSNGQSLDSSGEVGPAMGGVFITVGGDYMFKPSLGFGAEYSARAAQADYAPQASVNYRPVFYDFNAIWHPLASHGHIVPEVQGGVGGLDLKFYETESECAIQGVCQTLNQYIASSNHFQLHLSGGVRVYVNPSVFIRPQVDVHWVNNLQEFGRSWVPEYSVAVGYTFGER
jgi:hypothetical protein